MLTALFMWLIGTFDDDKNKKRRAANRMQRAADTQKMLQMAQWMNSEQLAEFKKNEKYRRKHAAQIKANRDYIKKFK